MLFVVSALEKDRIGEHAEKKHLQHGEKHEFQANLRRGLEVGESERGSLPEFFEMFSDIIEYSILHGLKIRN